MKRIFSGISLKKATMQIFAALFAYLLLGHNAIYGMALIGLNVGGQGTIWNLPNYIGEIFTASITKTPILAMVGGINGVKETTNFEFPIDQTYAHPAAAQPSITETASLTAPTAIGFVRSQDKNVVQIVQESGLISYVKMSNQGRLSGIATAGQPVNPPSEKDWQIMKTLEKIARDTEYSFIQGTYAISTNAGVANTTRGLNRGCKYIGRGWQCSTLEDVNRSITAHNVCKWRVVYTTDILCERIPKANDLPYLRIPADEY